MANVASKDVIVHDPNLDIDRLVVAGQPVPPDLVEAYENKTGENLDVARVLTSAERAQQADEETAAARKSEEGDQTPAAISAVQSSSKRSSKSSSSSSSDS
jgi:hypothetical protein